MVETCSHHVSATTCQPPQSRALLSGCDGMRFLSLMAPPAAYPAHAQHQDEMACAHPSSYPTTDEPSQHALLHSATNAPTAARRSVSLLSRWAAGSVAKVAKVANLIAALDRCVTYDVIGGVVQRLRKATGAMRGPALIPVFKSHPMNPGMSAGIPGFIGLQLRLFGHHVRETLRNGRAKAHHATRLTVKWW